MAEQTPDNTATAPAHTELWVERTGTRLYTGKSSRGAEVLPISRRLGDNYDATVRVSGAADRENEVYPQLDEVLELDLSELDAEAQQRLITLVERSVDKVCTVGRTLKAGTKVTLSFDTEA
jgi:hypothetical protein